ncbi:MAG: 4-hydroxythreonine-4-phosphate dehydrogenase PdxA [candidate division WOR-3 bacterium]|nr:4-hydroxythreonine-4-phosphate dehydrogenase PdxA [candidate division WOR-3 bacterium]
MIGITLGDPGGIGIEVVLRALPHFDKAFILFGNKKAVEYYSHRLNLPLPKNARIVNIQGNFKVGEISAENGKISYNSIIEGIKAVRDGVCKAIVTAPIHKKAMHLAGYNYPGHTELFAEKLFCDRYAMMMVSDNMKVIFVTTHIPISVVSSILSKEEVIQKVKLARVSLKHYWGITSPSFGILGLNPHAGDSGLFGTEEVKILKPAIRELKEKGFNVEGPFPPDTYWVFEKKDCTVALYHDQGMIPFKLMSYGRGVNVTLGLPFPRTSPDHGTAFDIVGKGLANSGSMEKAIELAIFMSNA